MFAADSSHLLSVLGFDQAGHENRTLPVEACEKQVSENNRIVSCLSVTVVEYYSSYSMYLYLVT